MAVRGYALSPRLKPWPWSSPVLALFFASPLPYVGLATALVLRPVLSSSTLCQHFGMYLKHPHFPL